MKTTMTPDFSWSPNGTAAEALVFRSKEAMTWARANLPVSDRIHLVEFYADPPRAVVHRYPGPGVSRYEAPEPPSEVSLEALPPESLRP
jgi:hypothetical protein